jgi:hypothetical protein
MLKIGRYDQGSSSRECNIWESYRRNNCVYVMKRRVVGTRISSRYIKFAATKIIHAKLASKYTITTILF